MRQSPTLPCRFFAVAAALAGAMALAAPAHADRIAHPTAVFNGLDKITGRIIAFEVAINETVQFGSLYVTPRVCYSRPATEAPQTTVFMEVEETEPGSKAKKIFAGWMFASSPGLNAVEHPVYDVWLTDCKGGTEIIRDANKSTEPEEEIAETPQKPAPRRAQRPVRKPAPQPAAGQGPVQIGPPPGAAPPRQVRPQ